MDAELVLSGDYVNWFPHWQRYTSIHGCRRDFFQGGHSGIFLKFFQGGQMWWNLFFPHPKLKKTTFFAARLWPPCPSDTYVSLYHCDFAFGTNYACRSSRKYTQFFGKMKKGWNSLDTTKNAKTHEVSWLRYLPLQSYWLIYAKSASTDVSRLAVLPVLRCPKSYPCQ